MWNDQLQLIKTFTFRRGWNFLLLFCQFLLSRILKKPIISALPYGISIEPTTSCNLRCSQCPSGLRSFHRPTGMLQNDLFKKIIDDVSLHAYWLTFYFQGEPYLNTSFLDMVAYASTKNMYTMTSTNAHYFTNEIADKTVKSGLSKIIISIDGTDQETYEKYRTGGQLEKVLEGTKKLVTSKKKLQSKTPHIVFQFIAFSHNLHQIEEVKKLGKMIGVDEVKIKSAQVYEQEDIALIPDDQNYARYTKNESGFKIKNDIYNHCWRMWSSTVVTWDGKVIPCCFDKDAKYTLGSLSETNFESIWKSDTYQKFRKTILKNRSSIDICTNCTEGSTVWI